MDEPEIINRGSTFNIQDTSDEFNLSNKLLLESFKYAFVYTTRIDDMKVTKYQNSPELLIEILQQSKPIFNEKRAKKNMFKKRLNKRYDLKKLQSNPDFNWKKKKDSIGYQNLRCLSDARRLCKPVTIDLCKIDKFLGEGSVELHLLERNISLYNKQNYLKHDLSESSETISAYSDYSDIENVNPLGIQIVETCSLSTEHKKEEPIMKNNFSECRNSAPYRAILVMIDENRNTQKIYDVQIGSCNEIRSTYNTVSSHINIKYCCYCKRNLILQNLVKNQLLIPVTTLKYFCQNILCSTNTCDCCCKFTVHTNVICYIEKKKYNAVSKRKLENVVVQPMKKNETETLSKFQYRYVNNYIERGIQETEEMYVIFSYVKKYSNKYNPKHKYEVYHIDKLSRIKSHLTYIVPPVLRVDSPKYMFELCCWFKRIKIVYSLEVALAKSLTYLKTIHSCSFNNCNCCCSALSSTIPAHKDWDVRNCPLLARSISSDIDILRARWKPPKQYDICAKRKSNVICSKKNLQADSGIAGSINSTKNVQEVPQKPAELINIPESHTTSVANGNIDSGLDIENSLPAYVLATKTKSTDLPSSLENNDNNINLDAMSIFKQARLRLTPDGRLTAIFSNLEQKLTQDQLMGMCKILNIAQKRVHLIDFSKENAMEDVIKITSPEFNEINDTTSVPIITDVFSLAEPTQKSKKNRDGAAPSKNITQPSVSQPSINVDVIPPSVIQPILYRAILDQSNVSQRNAGQFNVGQANVFFPITIQGQNNIQSNIIQQNNIVPNSMQQNNIVPNTIQQNNIVPNIIQQNNIVPNIIQQNNILPNIIQQNNIPSNVGSIILPDNMILLPNLVVAPNYNLNIVNTISDNSSVRHESHQGVKRQAVLQSTIDNSVKRFASDKLVNPFPIVQSVNSTLGGGQQENFQNESELENESESILGL